MTSHKRSSQAKLPERSEKIQEDRNASDVSDASSLSQKSRSEAISWSSWRAMPGSDPPWISCSWQWDHRWEARSHQSDLLENSSNFYIPTSLSKMLKHSITLGWSSRSSDVDASRCRGAGWTIGPSPRGDFGSRRWTRTVETNSSRVVRIGIGLVLKHVQTPQKNLMILMAAGCHVSMFVVWFSEEICWSTAWIPWVQLIQ